MGRVISPSRVYLCLSTPHPPPLFCFLPVAGSIYFSWYGCLGLLLSEVMSVVGRLSLPTSSWVAAFRPLSSQKWLMPAESQSRLAQSQLLLYYVTSCRCQYRHKGGSLPTSVLCCHPAPASPYLSPPSLKGQGRFHNSCNNNFGNPTGGDTQIGKCHDSFLIDFSLGRGGKSPTPYLQMRARPPSPPGFPAFWGWGSQDGHPCHCPFSALLTCSLVAMQQFYKNSEASSVFFKGESHPTGCVWVRINSFSVIGVGRRRRVEKKRERVCDMISLCCLCRKFSAKPCLFT